MSDLDLAVMASNQLTDDWLSALSIDDDTLVCGWTNRSNHYPAFKRPSQP